MFAVAETIARVYTREKDRAVKAKTYHSIAQENARIRQEELAVAGWVSPLAVCSIFSHRILILHKKHAVFSSPSPFIRTKSSNRILDQTLFSVCSPSVEVLRETWHCINQTIDPVLSPLPLSSAILFRFA